MAPQAETIRASAHWQPLSWRGWAPHLLWVWRYVKRTTARGRGQSQSPSEAARERLSSFSPHGHWADVSSLVTGCSKPLPRCFFLTGPCRSLKRKLSASAERQDWNSRNESRISPSMTYTQHECHQRAVESCTSYNDAVLKFALLVRLIRLSLDGGRGSIRICKLPAARCPIQLLRRFNGGSRHQRRVSEEGSSSLQRRNLRCGDKAAAYIARRPSYFGGLWQAAGRAIGSFFLVLHEPIDVQLHCMIKKLFFPYSVSRSRNINNNKNMKQEQI